jgi:tetratricopeptide (TPR) repeat protein
MIEPISMVCLAALGQITGALTIGNLVGGVVGNQADNLFCKVMRNTVDHFVKNARLPENHDLLKGMMAAHRRSLIYVADTMATQAGSSHDRIVADKIGLVVANGIVAESQKIAPLMELVTPLIAGDAHGEANARLDRMLSSVINNLVGWLEAETKETMPSHFQALFTQEAPNGRAPWVSIFKLYLAEEIKTHGRYERIFLANNVSELIGRTITIEAIGRDLGRGLEALREQLGIVAADVKQVLAKQQSHSDQLAELLALARQGGIFQQASEQGISEIAVRAIVESLGGEGVGKDDLVTWLKGWVEAATEALGHHSNEGEAFEAAKAEAERRFRAGQVTLASDPFMELLKREKKDTTRRQIVLLEEAIRFDKLALNISGIANKIKLLATANGAVEPAARALFFINLANEHFLQGRDGGDNFALLIAIAAARLALEQRTRERVPLEWGKTLVFLAGVLVVRGQRENSTVRLEEAVMTFRLALEEVTRQREPLVWALTQSVLASALVSLGERESGITRLEEGAEAYRLALREHTRERTPLDWARIQTNLAGVLITLGQRETRTDRLEEAVAACRLALEERTRERTPLDWAGTQSNLAVALFTLGQRERSTDQVKEAVTVCRLALREQARERVPLNWATTQTSLANALSTLGILTGRTDHLEEAVAVHRLVLEERRQERVPLDWGKTQMYLARVLVVLGQLQDGTMQLEEAAIASRLALQELTRERVPLDWARAQVSLANALTALGERESGADRLNEAVIAARLAAQELTRERVPLDWAGAQVSLATALAVLGERIEDLTLLDEAKAIVYEFRLFGVQREFQTNCFRKSMTCVSV